MSLTNLKFHEERLEFLLKEKARITEANAKAISEYNTVIRAIAITENAIKTEKKTLKKQSKYLSQFQEVIA
jgi:hypothetical protein